jgi:Iron-containing redox enzyme
MYRPSLPAPRGALSEFVIERLRAPEVPTAVPDPERSGDPLSDDDFALALYVAYELHYRGFAGVDEELEWDPGLLAFRRGLEHAFLDRLFEECGSPPGSGNGVESDLQHLIDNAGGPALSAYMVQLGTLAEMREFAVHRSAYQLKEADPHTWTIPRLEGSTKAALVQIQADEYGDGVTRHMHQQLFVATMQALGLDPTYGAYVDALPGTTLATVNLITLFGLHRRWRGALVGNLAVYEMTSVVPMGRYSSALERLGVAAGAREFYDVHVEADAEHQLIALHELAGGLARDEPDLYADIMFGARATLDVEARFAQHMLDAWASSSTSLRRQIASAA